MNLSAKGRFVFTVGEQHFKVIVKEVTFFKAIELIRKRFPASNYVFVAVQFNSKSTGTKNG